MLSAIKIVPEYERGVVFRLGRLIGPRGPGLFFLIPIFERMVRVDIRVITMDVPSQEVITLDNVTIKVLAPFVDAATYGLELIYPYDSVCHVWNRNGEIASSTASGSA